jgi:glucokinase
MAYYIGLDLGGTNIKAGVADENGRAIAKVSVPTGAEAGPDRVIANIASAGRQAVEAAKLSLRQIDYVGIGAPGPVNFDAGIVLAAPNLPGWKNIPLRDRIAADLGRPAVLENDGNAAAFAELWAGAGRDPSIRHLLMLTLGTGVGGGFIANGKLIRGANGYGSEPGHIIVNPAGARHTSGSPGCLEQYASAHACGKRAAELIEAGHPTSLKPVYDAAKKHVSAKDVFAHARLGDQIAEQVVSEVTQILGIACVNLCRVFDPQMIVFAGGMILAGDDLFDRVRKVFRQFTWSIESPEPLIVPSQLGNDAGFIGAAAVARDKHTGGLR